MEGVSKLNAGVIKTNYVTNNFHEIIMFVAISELPPLISIFKFSKDNGLIISRISLVTKEFESQRIPKYFQSFPLRFF